MSEYTSKNLWIACHTLLPNIKLAMDKGISFNLPSVLDMVAKEHFIRTEEEKLALTKEEQKLALTKEEQKSIELCKRAMRNLKVNGFLELEG